jgi:hypothetical protein
MIKKTKIIISLVVVLVISIPLLYYFIFVVPKKEIAEKCQGYYPYWGNFVDCQGVIAINDGWDMDYLSIKDHIHNYEIARVYNRNQYIYSDNKIFVINKKNIKNSSSDGIKNTYYQELFQNGQLMESSYEVVSDIPTYLVVDTVSGETKAYKTISDVPKDQQIYFNDISTH